VFDHIEAAKIEEGKSFVILRLANNTAYDAAVSVFAENARSAAQPMGYTMFARWPKVNVPAGGDVTVKITADGKVQVKF
jgi:hypothetical protein